MANIYGSAARGAAIALGKQADQETPVTVRSGMKNVLFPTSAGSLGPDGDSEESNLITAYGAGAAPQPGQEWASGGWVTRILPSYFHFLLEGILNPITSASVELVSPVAAITTSVDGAAFSNITDAKSRPSAGAGNNGAPALWPSKINIDGGTVAGASAANPVILTLKGLRRGGRRTGTGVDRLATFYQEEIIKISTNAAISNLKTTKMWDTIQSAVWTFPSGASITGTTTLTWDADTYKTELTYQLTDPQHPGFTILNLIAGRPDRIIGYIMSEMSIAAGSDGIDVTFAGTGIRYDKERTISTLADFDAPKVALEAADTSYYTRPSLKSFPGWAGALAFGDINDEANIVKYSSIDMNINRNYGPAPGIDGRKFRTGVSQDGNRVTTFSPTSLMRVRETLTDILKNYHELYRAETSEELTMRNLSYSADGRQEQMDWMCPNAKIIEMPREEYTGPGQVESPLVFQAEPMGNVSELKVVMYTKDQLYT